MISDSNLSHRTTNLSSLVVALGFFLLTAAWGLASPPGSAGDDGFHTSSIYCASGSNEFCEILTTDSAGNPLTVKIPEKIGEPCIHNDSRLSGACIAGQEGRFTESTGVNVDHVSGLFYSVMNKLLRDGHESSIVAMRTFNAFLFSSLLFLALASAAPRLRRGIALMLLTAMVPIAVYTIPSINPSSWAITGVLFSWIFLFALFSTIGKSPQVARIVAFSIGLGISLILVLGARKDSALYVFVGVIANLIIFGPRLHARVKWVFTFATVTGGFFAYLLLRNRIGDPTDLIAANFFSPASVISNLVEIPSVIASIIGSSIPALKISPVMYYGLEMPFNVILITLTTLAGLVFTLLPGIQKRALVAISFVIFMMIAIQMYPLTLNGLASGASPRLMAPLFLVVVAMFFTVVRIKPDFPLRAQRIWIFLAMPTAGAIALLTIIRRYTNGPKES
jgi:hypothetical protein